ncbi:MAG: universal stress protein, partial [Anaerolineae bacterium]
SAFEGALAGGGDPATSPLYVFTPFLKLIVLSAAAGVATTTFGASVWLVVLTVVVVSMMYRRVMQWVTDGSGGSGLSEEEFGGWAVKTNGAITYIEYTLTFLVSLAAMVTFLADRFPALNSELPGISARALVAVALSVATGWLVNRGPKTAARFFGPATFGVLVLLWSMIGATVWYHYQAWAHGAGPLVGAPILPTLDLQAFSLAPTSPGEPSYLHFTLGGYARILALMTGIEVFANLVAAYGGDPQAQARKAFGSLVIIMGSTAMTMLVVGPAIFALADPANTEVSVFTQTMDVLLPAPGAYAGTLVGVAVLLSAAAASAEGIQNLSLGLATRRYIPPMFGRANRFGVAALPVWVEVAVCCVAFVVIGTSEETYLAIYAAGVFILLSMTGWSASRRLLRDSRAADGGLHAANAATLAGSMLAALLTTAATLVIFRERFFEGAWVFFLFIPAFYLAFTYVRRRAGLPAGPRPRPTPPAVPQPLVPAVARAADEMRDIVIRPGEPLLPPPPAPRPIGLGGVRVDLRSHVWPTLPAPGKGWRGDVARLEHVVVALDGTAFAALALPLAADLAGPGRLTLLSAVDSDWGAVADARRRYLEAAAADLEGPGRRVATLVRGGQDAATTIATAAEDLDADAIVLTSRGRPAIGLPVLGSVAGEVVQIATRPVVIVRPRP